LNLCIGFPHEIFYLVGRSKKGKKKRKKEVQNSLEKGEGYNNQKEVYTISSGDDDSSKGMKSMNC